MSKPTFLLTFFFLGTKVDIIMQTTLGEFLFQVYISFKFMLLIFHCCEENIKLFEEKVCKHINVYSDCFGIILFKFVV